jgi:hypothetical protein
MKSFGLNDIKPGQLLIAYCGMQVFVFKQGVDSFFS